MSYRPYNGAADQMLGPQRYGYTDAGNFLYGEKGGRFLYGSAGISQEPLTPKGEKRLPVWSNEADDLVVACPSWMVIETIEQDTENEGLVWVHQVSRETEHWRHDRHPLEPEDLLEVFASTFKKAAKEDALVTFDSLPRGNYGIGSKSGLIKAKTPRSKNT